MEFRIGITKKLIENLGPNFSDLSVKQVNQPVDVKEFCTSRPDFSMVECLKATEDLNIEVFSPTTMRWS